MKSILLELYESARRTSAPVLTVVGLSLAFLPFWVSSNSTIPARWVILIGTAAVVVIAVLTDATIRLGTRARHPLPKVRVVMNAPKQYPGSGPLVLLEPDPLFAPEIAVALYANVEGFEVLIGLGRVMTIQQDGTIQVLVLRRLDSPHGDFWTNVLSNRHMAGGIIVRPSIPNDLLLLEGGNQ